MNTRSDLAEENFTKVRSQFRSSFGSDAIARFQSAQAGGKVAARGSTGRVSPLGSGRDGIARAVLQALARSGVEIRGKEVKVRRSLHQSCGSLWLKMANVLLEFKASAGDSEPPTRPVLIVGQLGNLQQLSWAQVKGKLQPAVTKEVSFT